MGGRGSGPGPGETGGRRYKDGQLVGRRKGQTNLDTRDTKSYARAYWARAARKSWQEERNKALKIPKAAQRNRALQALGAAPSEEDLEACVNYLNSLDHAAMALAMQRQDYAVVHEILEDARDRALGRVKYDLDQDQPMQINLLVGLNVNYPGNGGAIVPVNRDD